MEISMQPDGGMSVSALVFWHCHMDDGFGDLFLHGCTTPEVCHPAPSISTMIHAASPPYSFKGGADAIPYHTMP